MSAELERIIRGAIGYNRVPLSVTDHPEIRFGFRTAADADGITERVTSALIAAGVVLTDPAKGSV